MPPASVNALICGIVVACVTLPTVRRHSAGSASVSGAPPGPPGPPAVAGRGAGIAPSTKISASYLRFRLPASSSCGYTTVNGNSYCSSNHRVHPLGIDPPKRSHSPMRIGRTAVAPAAEPAANDKPSSRAARSTIGRLPAVAGMIQVPSALRDTEAFALSKRFTTMNASFVAPESAHTAAPATVPAGGRTRLVGMIFSNGPFSASSTRSYCTPICIAKVQPALS